MNTTEIIPLDYEYFARELAWECGPLKWKRTAIWYKIERTGSVTELPRSGRPSITNVQGAEILHKNEDLVRSNPLGISSTNAFEIAWMVEKVYAKTCILQLKADLNSIYRQMNHICLCMVESILNTVESGGQAIHKKSFKKFFMTKKLLFGAVLQLVLLLAYISMRQCRMEKPYL